MSRSDRSRPERPQDDLGEVIDALFEARPTLDPLALDRVKLRAMESERRSAPGKRVLRTRLAMLGTVGLLSLGTGGALAVAGNGHGNGGNGGRNASFSQYRPGCGLGDKNHTHTGPDHKGIEACPSH
jgi:hypothetical protein